MIFIDKAKIHVTAGRGGAGCVAFRREKYVPLGGPNGGNGGKGGDVYLMADSRLTTLLDFTYRPKYKAEDGQPGKPKDQYGKGGDDLVIHVPTGTVAKKDGKFLADLKEDGHIILVVKAGRGGRGNTSFKTSRHPAPKISEKGEPGEEAELELELKLIADVGLVGFPNAGKSTLLSRVSAATPKIANYPFTTLSPNLGVVKAKGKDFVIADIPGLIEGAHDGKGLGDEFLRHIQRTKVLIHIIDIFGFDYKPAYKNYRAINNELKKYADNLLKKPMLIAANKTDLTDSKKEMAVLKKHIKGKKIFPVSAATGEGLDKLLAAVVKELANAKEDESFSEEAVKEYKYEPQFSVNKSGDAFVITGTNIERLVEMTNFDQEDSLFRFQNILKRMGIDSALKAKGVVIGDVVRVGKFEFVYES